MPRTNIFTSATTNDELDLQFEQLADEIHASRDGNIAAKMQRVMNDYSEQRNKIAAATPVAA